MYILYIAEISPPPGFDPQTVQPVIGPYIVSYPGSHPVYTYKLYISVLLV